MKNFLSIFLLISGLLFFNNPVGAVTAYPYPIEYQLPDGSFLTIQLRGDEKVKWAESSDGFSLLLNKEGYYEYAVLDGNGNMVPCKIRTNNVNDRTNNEKEFLNSIPKGLRYSQMQLSIMKQIWEIRVKEGQKAFPTSGSRSLVCILMGFTDKAFTKTQSDFTNLFNQVGYTTGGATGSVKDFFNEASYNQFNLSVTVAGPYTAANNMAYYGANDASGNDLRPDVLVTEAVNAANADVNYADFDNDNDGNVDGVYVIYAGYGEEGGAPANTIWAHAWEITPVTLDGKVITTYSCSSELRGTTGSNITRIGVICHEFGHTLGAPDFYDTDYATSGEYDGMGEWDLQAGGSWNNSGATPAHPNAYTKIYIYGWASATTISSGASLNLTNSAQNSNSFYRYNTATTNEFFLLENRQQVGFDASNPGHGLLIYHVDGSYISSHQGSNNINAGSHQGLYPMSATSTTTTGIMLIATSTINTTGCPFPGTSNKTSFTDATTPCSKSWAGASINKPLTNIAENTTLKTISLDFMGGGATATITVSVSSLNFEKVYSGFSSRPQSYLVTGANLTGNITVTAPTGIQVASSCSGTYGSSVNLTQTGGAVNATVYAKYTGGAVSANITHVSSGATTKNVSLNETSSTTNLPGSYYSTATGTGATLKTNLYNIIKGHTQRSYAQLWTDYQTTDVRPDGKVWDIYTANTCGTSCSFTFVTDEDDGTGGTAECQKYNREHSFPKSWFGGDVAPMYTDLFHLMPTDKYVNNQRSNYAFGEVSSGTTYNNGAMLGTNTYSGSTGTIVYEPADEFKGDLARNYFYMATRYENIIAGWEANDVNGDEMLDGSAFPCFEPWALNMLLAWNSADPVDQKELARNDAIYSIQGNRNPFIDNPNYVQLIWGTNPVISVTPSILSGFSYTQGSGPSVSQTYSLSGSNLSGTGNITVTGSTNYEVSTDNSTFSSSATFAYASGVITGQPKTVYVRLKSGLTAGSYNGEVIANSGGSASTVNVTCYGQVNASGGTTTIFTESMGTVGGTTTIAAHETANGFDNDSYTMTQGGATNPADIRATSVSSGYTGASGIANIWFTSTSGSYGFAIEGIDASSYTSLIVQFGYRKESGTALPAIALDYWNGSAYVNVAFTFNEAAGASVAWYLSPQITLPAGAQISGLKLRWVKSGTTAARIDDIKLTGTLSASTPTITLSASAFTGFTYVFGSGPSASQTYNLMGSNLTPASGNLTVTGSTNYEVSTDNSSFGSSKTVAYTSGTLTATPFYIRLKSGLSVASYDGETVANSGGGATTQNLTCSGSVSALPNPLITISATSLAFGDICTGNTSAEQTYTVSGSYLTGNITITPPSAYEISTGSGTSFVATNPITLTQSGGSVGTTDIFVRFVPVAVQSYSGNISHVSSGATQKNVALTGNGVSLTPSVSSPSSTNYSATSADLGGSISSIGCSNVTERGIYYSTTDGFADGTGTKVSETGTFGTGSFTLNVSGLSGATTYYFKAFATSSRGTSYTLQGNFSTVKPEPENQPGAFTANPGGSSQIDLTWTDAAAGSQAPDYYLIMVSTGSTFSDPVDGTDIASDADMSDGTGIFKVAHGIQVLAVTGLTQNTQYYFKMWPYTNSGTNINFKTDGTIQTATTTTNAATTACASDLIISEYLEGSSYNKYIEIYNGTSAVIDLSNYKLQLFSNGASSASVSNTLSGSLAVGATIVYMRSNSTIYSGAATVLTSMDFNGDDAIALYKISPAGYVDIIGRVGEDPGTEWVSGSHSTLNKTLVRKTTVTAGISSNPGSGFPTLTTEWDVYSQDVVSYLGSHTMTCASSISIIASTNTLSGFNYLDGNGPSASQSYTITGSNLVGSGNITVTGSTNYEVSTDNSAFSGSVTYPYASGIITSQPKTVYVRLKSGLSAGNYNNENITHTGGSATAVNVVCSGAVTAPTPVITTSISSLSGFSCIAGAASSSQNYTVSGDFLTADVTVTAPTDFEVSTDDVSFSASVVLVQSGGNVTGEPKTVYIRIKASATAGAKSGNVTHVSSGATQKNVALTGNVYKIEPTNQVTSFSQGTVTTSAIPLTWVAAATGSQAPDGYLIKLNVGSVVDPADGTDPADVTAITSGAANKKITPGSATSATSFTGMTAGVMYNYKIYSYTNSGTTINFNLTSPPALNYATLPAVVTSPAITATGTTTASITWAKPGSYSDANHSILVFIKASSTVTTGTPSNAPSSYTANTAFSSGTPYQNDGSAYCVYNGDGTSVSISGLTANSMYYILIYTVVDASNFNASNSYSSGATANGTTAKIEPANQPTNIAATASSSSQINITWTDAAAGSQAPEYYLILVNTTGTFADPIDGTDPGTDNNMGDGSGIFKVAQGTGSLSVTGLSASTPYYFKMWPFTNSGTTINFKTDGTVLSANATTNTSSTGCATDLIISEYVEGSSNNKYIEIYNGTSGSVDLSNYKLRLFSNGASSASQDIALSGSLTSGTTIVYKNSSATIYGGTATSNAAVAFSGNDAVALYKISPAGYVDIFGRIGEDPGTAWTSGSHSTADKTLVRKSSVTSGITTNPGSGFPTLTTEWDYYNTDVVTYLGSHTMDCVVKPEPTNQPTAMGASATSSSQINVTWTDAAAGSQAPDYYLVLVNTSGTFADPVDGTDPTADSDLSDGSGIFKVAQGTQSLSVTGLTASTQYYFKMWPYTNAGSSINFKTDGTIQAVNTTTSASASPVSLWFQGFEGAGSDTWTIVTGTPSSTTGSGDTPASQRIRTGSKSWQTNNATGTMELQSKSVSGYTDLKVIVYLSSTSTNGTNGADAGDYTRIFIALNGGSFASNSQANADIAVNGNSNSRWSYNNTENATTTAGTNLVVAGTSGTNLGTIYSKLRINIPNGTSSVALKIITLNNDGTEVWNIDDIEIIGTSIGYTPPTITAQPGDLNKCAGENTSFTVNASGTITGYQWVVNTGDGTWTDLGNNSFYSGVTTATLSLTGVITSMNNYQYCVKVINQSCSTYSNSVKLLVNPTPAEPLISETDNQCGQTILTRGNPADGSVWFWQGTNVAGTSTSDNASTYSVTQGNDGSYYLRAQFTSSGCWSETSNSQSVTVKIKPVVSLSNATAGCGEGSIQINSDQNADQTFELLDENGDALSPAKTWNGIANLKIFEGVSSGNYKGRVTHENGCASNLPGSATSLTNNAAVPEPSISDAFRCGTGTILITGNASSGNEMQFFEHPTTVPDDATTPNFTDNTEPYQYTTSSLTNPATTRVWGRMNNTVSGCKSQWMAATATTSGERGLWTGSGSDTYWTTSDNWSDCTVPLIADDVIIPTGRTVVINSDVVCNNLNVDGGASFTIENGHLLSVSGNVQISASATVTFSGTLQMNGSSLQTISGETLTLNNLIIDNNNGVNSESDLVVENTLNLTSGILTLTDKTLTIGTSSASRGNITGTFGASCYIAAFKSGASSAGKIKRFVENGVSFLFPVGDNNEYSPMTIEFTSGTFAGNANIEVYVADEKHPQMGDPTWYITRYWKYEPTGISNPMYNVAFTYLDADVFTGTELLSYVKQHIYPIKYSPGGWIASRCESDLTYGFSHQYGQGEGSNGGGSNTLTWTGVYSFSEGSGAGGSGGSLPVELLYFKAYSAEGKVNLNWATASETNNHYFTLKRSADAIKYEVLSTFPGQGTTQWETQYAVYDENPLPGITYYQLCQTDYDGTSRCPGFTTVNLGILTSDQGYYVVNKDQVLKICSSSTFDGFYMVEIYDQMGRMVYSNNYECLQQKAIVVKTALIPNNLYYIKIKSSRGIASLRFIN